jgi:carboxypeptidase Taq
MHPKFNELLSRVHEIHDLRTAASILSWDQETQMPRGGAPARANQLATLNRLSHQKLTDEAMGQLLDELKPITEPMPYDSFEASLVRIVWDEFERMVKVPTELVVELTRTTTAAHEVWREAREKSAFELFRPVLEKLVGLIRRYAECFTPYERIYDPLLDRAERGLTTNDLLKLFETLKKEIVPLVKAIAGKSDAVDDSVLWQAYDEQKQWDFGLEVARAFGYDMERGRQDRSTHPFTTGFSMGDVRITTRVNPNFLSEGLFATLHETGHGLYMQGHDWSLERTPLAYGISGGYHESQSRMWENLVGRSREFWQHWFPRLRAYFPAQLAHCDVEQFYRAVNRVMPSLIRVEADEVTYNLHIMLRCELEIDMLEGRLPIKDLPQTWNAKVQKYLGITPPNDREGCLQDIHWSSGFGSFPSYLLGNLYGAQLFERALQDMPDLRQQFARGEYLPLLEWYRTNLHVHGRKFKPKEMTQRLTGKLLSVEPWARYVKGKFGEIYGV